MIIRDFDLHGTLVVGPPEANSVLDVDADAPLVVTVALEFFQAVAGRHPQIVKDFGRVENEELAQCRTLRVLIKSPRAFTSPDPFGVLVAERPQHLTSIT